MIASTLSPETHAVRGTDNVYHVVYELQLDKHETRLQLPFAVSMCWRPRMLRSSITSFSGPDVVKRMRTLTPAPAADAKIGPRRSSPLLYELAFKDAARIRAPSNTVSISSLPPVYPAQVSRKNRSIMSSPMESRGGQTGGHRSAAGWCGMGSRQRLL